jgi:hypothetical protein
VSALHKTKTVLPKKGGTSPVKTKKNSDSYKAKSELFMTAVSTFYGEDTFYESGDERAIRLCALVKKVTKSDPEWMQRFIPWLRGTANIRTASIVIAAEYVLNGGPNAANVIFSVCQRADEPAEFLAYYMHRNYGHKSSGRFAPSPRLPQAVRKGLARAAINLYDEYSVMKYNGRSRGVNMENVLDLVHPSVKQYPSYFTTEEIEKKQAVMAYVADRRRGKADLSRIPMVAANEALRGVTRSEAMALTPEQIKAAGLTWEQYGGLLGGAWTAEAWTKMIPSMGYMALLRNLRNFDGVGISSDTVDEINKRLSDPEQVARSRQLPFRFFSAYKNVDSVNYSLALERALDHSVRNIPTFTGRTLVLIDKSGSMGHGYNQKPNSPVPWEIGALFGVALALKGEDVDLAIFGSTSKKMRLKSKSVLPAIQELAPNNGVGHSTDIWGSIGREWDGHDRVVVFTDMQDNHYGQFDKKKIPFIHFFDVGGYGRPQPDYINGSNQFNYGGFTDATFSMMLNLENGLSESWPF